MGKYIKLTSDNFEEKIKSGTVLVNFGAPWCTPCRKISPIFEKIAEEFNGKASICEVNTDENEDLVVKYEIKSIPTILFMKDGKIVDTMVAPRDKQVYTDKLNSILST